MSILDEAHNLVHVERRKDYEHPAIFFSKQANLFSALIAEKLKTPITPQEACMFMILFKTVREHGKPKRDNRADKAGYVECLDMIEEYFAAVDKSAGQESKEE